jgi:hypothetical protein
MGFNLDDYETVAERLDRAIKDHPDHAHYYSFRTVDTNAQTVDQFNIF